MLHDLWKSITTPSIRTVHLAALVSLQSHKLADGNANNIIHDGTWEV